MLGFLHLFDTVVNRIEQRRAMPGAHRGQPRLDLIHRVGKVLNQFRPVVEPNDKKLVLRIGRLDELQNRFSRANQL